MILCSFLWNKITLPYYNPRETIGYLSTQNINYLNDTIRYVLFIMIPITYFFFYTKIVYPKKLSPIKNLFSLKKEKKNNFYFKDVKYIFLFFTFIIFLNFFSSNLPNMYLDNFHYGDYLTPGFNLISKGSFWQSSLTIHGGVDFFYTVLSWKIFGVQSIGSLKFFYHSLNILVKLISIFFIFRLSQLGKLDKNSKILLFSLLSIVTLTLSGFNEQENPLNHRDLFVLVYLIFLVQFFKREYYHTSIIAVSLVPSIALIFYFDSGMYLYFASFAFVVYLFFSKQFIVIKKIIFLKILFWLFFILIFGLNELIAFFQNLILIVQNVDILHGLEFPRPFFSLGEDPDSARATRSLTLQLIAGLSIFYISLFKNNEFKNTEKIFFLIFFFITFITYKNALGRSDTDHIKLSSDWQVIIVSYFLIYFFINVMIKGNLKKIDQNKLKTFILIIIFAVNINSINIKNIKNFRAESSNLIYSKDEKFLKTSTKNLINFFSSRKTKANCIQNFTTDLSLPYLTKLPSCNKYFASWLISDKKNQEKYIEGLKNKNIQFIVYKAPSIMIDNLSTPTRLIKANKFIIKNFKEVHNLGGYVILERRL